MLLHDPSRWGAPFLVWGAVYGVFRVLDDVVAPNVKKDLSDFISSREYESFLGDIPSVVIGTFNRVFGEKHLSIKCLKMSVIISILSLVASLIYSVVLNNDAVSELTQRTPAVLEQIRKNVEGSGNFKELMDFIS